LIVGLIMGLTYGYVYGARIGLTYGSSFGVIGWLLSIILEPIGPTQLSENTPSRNPPRHDATLSGYLRIALITGLHFGSGYVLSTELTHQLHISSPRSVLANVLFYVLAYGLIGVLISVLLKGRKNGIQPAEVIVWSWRSFCHNLLHVKHLKNSLLIGLLLWSVMSLSFGLQAKNALAGFLFGLNGALVFGVSYWLLLELFKALSSAMLDERQLLKPNQGIGDSAKNSMLIGLISGFVSWSVCILSYMFGYAFIDNGNGVVNIGQFIAISIGPCVGLCVGLLGGLLNGGLACLRHWTLRLLLWRAGSISWNYPHFLDYAAERVLLRKIGGGYIFIHRILLEHFASLSNTTLSSHEEETRL
jgi:hypothetical protein